MDVDRWHLYRLMYASRRLEEAIARLWRAGRISGEMHLGIGEEAVIAGVTAHLEPDDALAADHRSTPPLAMRGVAPRRIVAECLGSEAGLGRGLGGHMHLMAPDRLTAASGIVGASGPLACGFALAHQRLRPGRVAVAFFGEGAMNQGMLLESLNLAAVWRLPVLFVCKDNGMAITTRSERVTAGDLPERARALGVPARRVDGSDAVAVWRAARDAVRRARRGAGPSYLHARCERPEGHFLGDPLLRLVRDPLGELVPRARSLVAAAIDPRGGGYGARLRGVVELFAATLRAARTRRDPLVRLRRTLRSEWAALERLEAAVDAEIAAEVDAALASASAPLVDRSGALGSAGIGSARQREDA